MLALRKSFCLNFSRFQTVGRSFSLALGTDTAKNSSVFLHDFSRLGVKVDLPLLVLVNDRPVVISFVWLKEGHFLDPPLINGVPNLPSLLRPCKDELCQKHINMTGLIYYFSPVLPDDPLYDYVVEDMRQKITIPSEEKEDLPSEPVTTNPADDDMDAKEIDLDLDYFLLVSGVMQIQLLQLPTQPKCYAECTVAPCKNLLFSLQSIWM